MKTIYVIGSLNMDVSIKTKRFPEVGETIEGSDFVTHSGGKGLNQAIACSKLGGRVKMLGAVGDDIYGRHMVMTLGHWDIDKTNVKIVPDVSTGVAMVVVSGTDNKIILDLGANLKVEKADVDKFLKTAASGDILLCQLETPLEVIGHALKVAKSKNMMTIVNPAPMNLGIVKYINYIDILTPNSVEMQALSENEEFIKSYKSHIITTLGKNGYSYNYRGAKITGKAFDVKVVDTTGAGDTFSGALAYKLSFEPVITKEVLDFCTKAASISTTRLGTAIASPTLREVEEW